MKELTLCIFHTMSTKDICQNLREDGRALLERASAIPIRSEVIHFALEKANEALLKLKKAELSGTAVLVL